MWPILSEANSGAKRHIPDFYQTLDNARFDQLSAAKTLWAARLFIHLFLWARRRRRCPRAVGRRGERNQLLALPLLKNKPCQRLSTEEGQRGAVAPQKPPHLLPMPLHIQPLGPRERLGGEHPVTSSDTQPSTPPRGKIGPCHTSKWDPATSRGIGLRISDGCTARLNSWTHKK